MDLFRSKRKAGGTRARRSVAMLTVVVGLLSLPIDAHAQSVVWARAMGGPKSDLALDVAVDDVGNVYSVGSFTGTADFDPGPGVHVLVATGPGSGFVSKLDSNGDFVWAKALGSQTNGVAVDGTGNVYVAGRSSGASVASVSKLSPQGEVQWSRSVTTASLIGFSEAFDERGESR